MFLLPSDSENWSRISTDTDTNDAGDVDFDHELDTSSLLNLEIRVTLGRSRLVTRAYIQA